MSAQQLVDKEQSAEVVETVALRNTPVVLTCRVGQTWRNFRSRFLGIRNDQLWVEYGQPAAGHGEARFEPSQKVGLAFKQKHYKFVFTTRVLQVADFTLSPTLKVRGLQVQWPEEMLRMQRRAFYRAAIPSDHQVFTNLWEGSQANEPKGASRERLVYSGMLCDLSAGGCRVRLNGLRDPGLQVGDPVGIEMSFQGGGMILRTDAQFRHADDDQYGIVIGMQFMGLTETPEGRKLLQIIGRIVGEYQRIKLRRNRSGVSGMI